MLVGDGSADSLRVLGMFGSITSFMYFVIESILVSRLSISCCSSSTDFICRCGWETDFPLFLSETKALESTLDSRDSPVVDTGRGAIRLNWDEEFPAKNQTSQSYNRCIITKVNSYISDSHCRGNSADHYLLLKSKLPESVGRYCWSLQAVASFGLEQLIRGYGHRHSG